MHNPLKSTIVTTTTLAVALFGYGRRAYAACTNSGGSSYLCSGNAASNNTTITINANDANVSTAAGFGLNSAAGAGLSIFGNGALSFSDTNASSIVTSGNSWGLGIFSGGDNGGTPGLITITGASTITGRYAGIYAINNGSGGISITADGAVTATYTYGIGIGAVITNAAATGDITITTGAASTITGGAYGGMYAINAGSGRITITADGQVSGGNGTYGRGIFAFSQNVASTGININTGVGSVIVGDSYGIYVQNYGSTGISITTRGDVTGTNNAGIFIQDANNTSTLLITDGSNISGTKGIVADSNSATDVTLNGAASAVSVTGTGGTAIDLSNMADTLRLQGIVSITGDVQGNGGTDTLSLDGTTTTLLGGGMISGFENIVLNGTSTINGNLNAVGSSLNATNGTLHVNGLFDVGAFTVGNGATFAGNNTLTGDLIIGNGGSLAPGNSIGTINTVGNVTFANGSMFDVELSGTTADLLNVTGNVNIDPGATLNLIPLTAFTGISTDIITASGTITGAFGTVIQNGANASVLYSPNSVTLSLLSVNTSTFNAQVNSSIGNSTLFSDTMLSQVSDQAYNQGTYYWANAVSRRNNSDAAGGFDGFSDRSRGVALGSQYSVNQNTKVGFSLANITSDLNMAQGIGSNDTNAVFGSVYTTYTQPMGTAKAFATLGATTGYHDNSGKRGVSNSGTPSIAMHDSHDTSVGGFLQIGAQFSVLQDWSITPKASLHYIQTYADGFTETGGGAAGVSLNNYEFGTLKTSQSARFAKRNGLTLFSGVVAKPYIEFGFSQENAVTDRDVSGTFSNSTGFTSPLNNRDQNFVNASIGANIDFAESIQGFIHYQHGESGDQARDDAQLGVSMKF